MSTNRVSLPVDLGGGLEVTDANLDKAYQHTEKGGGRGFYPIGFNAVWHGGVHLYAAKGSPVFAMFDGVVVAARLAGDADAAIGDFGSMNFIVVEHEVRGSVLNTLGQGSYQATKAYKFYSLYMHVAPLALDKGNAELAQVGWLAKPVAEALSASVGSGGGNKKADVEIVQKLLIRAGVDPGPVDGLIGSKTIAGIRAFQEKYLFSNPDGRIDVGGATWRALRFASLGVPKDDGFDEPLLGKLKAGKAINPGKWIAGGQQLWAVGVDGPEQATWMVQWEVFSEENLFKGLIEAVDEAPFTADTRKILAQLGGKDWIPGTGLVSGAQVARFFAEHADVPRLREAVVKFRSEWAADPDAMVAAMQGRFLTDGLKEKVEPYAWYPTIQAEAKLPPPTHFHYHPVTVLRHLRAMDPRRALAPPPAPPAPPKPIDAPKTGRVLFYDAVTDRYYVVTAAELQQLLAAHQKLAEAGRKYRQACEALLRANEANNAAQVTAQEGEVSRWRNTMTGLGYNSTPGDPKTAAIRELWLPDKSSGQLRPIYVGGKDWSAAKGWATKEPKTHAQMKQAYDEAKKKNFSGEVKLEFDWIEPYHSGYELFRKDWFDGKIKTEAQLLRYAHSLKAGVAYDPAKRKLEAKIEGGVSFDLVRWQSSAMLPMPEKGWVLPLTGGDKAVRIRMCLTGTLGAFIGAAAELSAGVDVNLKPDVGQPRAGAGAGVEAFVGAKATAEINLEFQWQENPNKGWGSLAKIGWKGSAAAGLGFSAKIRLDYNSTTQKFYFECGIELVVKLGVGSEWKWEVSLAEVARLVYAWLAAADFSRLDMITPSAFKAITAMGLAGAFLGVGTAVAMGAVWVGANIVSSVGKWVQQQERVDKLSANINGGKATFFLSCGTPESKAEAVYTLCQASSLRWTAEEEAERASIAILRSAKSRAEALKIVKALGKLAQPNSSTPVKAGFDYWCGLVDWGEQDQLNELLLKHKIIENQGALSSWKVHER